MINFALIDKALFGSPPVPHGHPAPDLHFPLPLRPFEFPACRCGFPSPAVAGAAPFWEMPNRSAYFLKKSREMFGYLQPNA